MITKHHNMHFSKFIILTLASFFILSCANKNVNETQNLTETVTNSNEFNAETVANAMCDCMETIMAEQQDKKVANAMAVAQRSCEKQGIVKFGNFKNDTEKVMAVNAMIDKNCGHLALSNAMPLQGQVQPAKGTSTKNSVQKEMNLYKKEKTAGKTNPKRKKTEKPKIEVEIE